MNTKVKRSTLIKFAVTYVILMGAFFLLITSNTVRSYLDINNSYSEFLVFLSSKLLNLFGLPSTSTETIIQLEDASLIMSFGCNGLESVLIYCLAVISFPASFKSKIIGILIGLTVIQIFNFLRIMGIAYIVSTNLELFEIVHVYIAQGIMIAISLLTFIIYLNLISYEQQET